MLIVAAAEIESSLLARRLGRWGARTCAVTDDKTATALLPERAWDALLVDTAAAQRMIVTGDVGAIDVPRRIVLITPAERHALAALKDAGFTGYLVKPVRAASLAARFAAEDSFEPVMEDRAADIESSGGATSSAGLSVLVAEDNEINALLARALLSRLGHRPTIVTDGLAAVAAYNAARADGSPYDLALMDVQMPGLDGLEATQHIRAAEIETGAPRTRILALTANAQAEDREACLAAGMDGFLVKPLDPERLRAAIVGLSPGGAATLAA